jgi:hypothetical protein
VGCDFRPPLSSRSAAFPAAAFVRFRSMRSRELIWSLMAFVLTSVRVRYTFYSFSFFRRRPAPPARNADVGRLRGRMRRLYEFCEVIKKVAWVYLRFEFRWSGRRRVQASSPARASARNRAVDDGGDLHKLEEMMGVVMWVCRLLPAAASLSFSFSLFSFFFSPFSLSFFFLPVCVCCPRGCICVCFYRGGGRHGGMGVGGIEVAGEEV